MKKVNRPVQKVNASVVGLDVHERMIAWTWLDRNGDEVDTGTIRASAKALFAVLDRIEGPVHVAFEAGGSTFWLYDLLVERFGAEYVHVAQPRMIRAIANSTRKNDAHDSWWQAYLTHEGRLPECYIPTGALRELRIAVRERFEIVKLITRTKVRLRAHLRQMGVKLGLRKLEALANWNALVELTESRDDVPSEAVASCMRRLEHLLAEQQAWERIIAQLAQDLPLVDTLVREIPGVGSVLAAVLVAELGPLDRFGSARAVGNYAGLTPSERSSAGKHAYGSITREGSEHLRWALTQAAMGCLRARSGPGLAAGNWIRAKERRMGCKGKARVAGARKLVESIWRLWHWGECFDAAKPFGGIPRPDGAVA